jgi:IS6 family transposase
MRRTSRSTGSGGTCTGAVDQYGQVIDVLVSTRRDADAARRFFRRALSTLKVKPTEVVTDAAAVSPAVPGEPIPQAWHHVEQHADNPVEAVTVD